MFTRRRPAWTASGAALLSVIVLSGIVAGANLVSDTLPTAEADAAPLVDTTATWEDTDGNGVDDDCQDAVVADPEAAATAEAAVDLDGDGTISVSDAAQSDRTGGENCNHGGYVSIVAQGDDEATDAEEATEAEDATSECEATEDPEPEPTPEDETTTEVVAPNAHGKAVSEVAKSDAVGGKNCNHGGAVSEAAKDTTLRDAAKAARDAAKAERAEARAAAKAERDAAKAERAAARAAAKAAQQGSKPGH